MKGSGAAGHHSPLAPVSAAIQAVGRSHLSAPEQRAKRHDRHWYHWAWKDWLPAKWQRIARCETGIRWDWNSGTYQGAFGFYWGSWDAFKPRGAPSEAYQATPRQQYQAALNIYRRYGYGAWGCGGA